MTIQEKAQWLSEFYAAVAAGKTVQCMADKWEDVGPDNLCGPDMTSDVDDWRIKPEPRRMWQTPNASVAFPDKETRTYHPDVAAGWKAKGYPVTEWVEVV